MTVHTHKSSDGEPITQEGRLASKITRELMGYTISIYECADGVLELCCSGFAVKYNERYFIFTAAHAIDVLIQKGCEIRFGFKGQTRALQIINTISTNMDDDSPTSDLDIGAWEVVLHPKYDRALKEVAVPSEYFVALDETVDSQSLFVCGFPLSINKHSRRETLHGLKPLSGAAYSYHSAEDKEFDLRTINKSKSKHIAIRWEDRDVQKLKITHPRGLSGSPVWGIYANETGFIARVAGIFIEFHSGRGIAVCTKVTIMLMILDWVRNQEKI